MRIKKKILQKVISAFASVLLLVNSFTPYLLVAPAVYPVKAQEETVTPISAAEVLTEEAPTVTPEITTEPTVEPTIEVATPTPTVEVSPTIEVTPVETVTPTEVPTLAPTEAPSVPSPPVDIIDTVTTESQESAKLVISLWQTNSDGSETTAGVVSLNQTYQAPQNNKVTVTFTKLPENPGKLTIKEVKLTAEQQADLGAFSDTAYDITSDMADGTFTYDLTLPVPESAKGKTIEVKSGETVDEVVTNAEVVDEPKEVKSETITITGLDHFTVFVLASPSVSAVDTTGIAWLNTGNIYTSNNAWATVTFTLGATSENLIANGFGLSIPTDAVIEGIEALVEKSVDVSHTNASKDSSVRLVIGGSIVGDNKALAAYFNNTTDAVTTYGSASDLWGLSLTAAQINASDFGVAYSAQRHPLGSLDQIVRVDQIQVKVYYNAPPVANDQSVLTNEDTPKIITLSATDADTDSLTYSIVSVPTHGTLGTVSGNLITYTPSMDYNGSDLFTFKANDVTVDSNTATVNITVNSINDPPSFDAIANQGVNENSSSQNLSITNVSPGSSDESGQVITMSATSSDPTIVPNPSVSGSGSTRTLTYTPATNQFGSVTITVIADDGQSLNNTYSRTFTITVNQDITPPETTINSSPSGLVNSNSATFVFSAGETSTFQCQIDGGGFSSCTSPKTYNGLSEGSHTFDVKATDTAGNTDLTPASSTWTVDTLPPTVSSAKVTSSTEVTIVFNTAVNCVAGDFTNLVVSNPATVDSISGTGTNTIVLTYSGGLDWTLATGTVDLGAGIVRSDTLTSLVPITQAIADGRKPTATITYSNSGGVHEGQYQTIHAQFSEDMSLVPITKIALSGANTVAAADMTRMSSQHYEYGYWVGAGNGLVTVTLSVGTDNSPAANIITSTPTSGATFIVDNIAPTTSDDIDGNWHKTDQIITLSCDDGTGAGCDATYYTTDGSTPTTSSLQGTTITFTTDGVYTVKYFSKDKAGNSETIKTAVNQVKIDKTPPTCDSFTVTEGTHPENIYTIGTNIYFGPNLGSDAIFTITSPATDSGSGVQSVVFDTINIGLGGVGGGSDLTFPYASSYNVGVGSNMDSISNPQHVHCYDNAGNTAQVSFNVYIDNAAPTISTVSLNHYNVQSGSTITVTSDGTDALTGVAECNSYWSTNTTYDFGVDTLLADLGNDCDGDITVPAGNGTFYVIVGGNLGVTDNVYNWDNTNVSSSAITIDNTPPTVAITAPIAAQPVKADYAITFTDNELTNAQCSIDNSVWVACISGTTTLNDITGFAVLSEGTFTLYLKDTDAAGNVGTNNVAGIIKDTTAPDAPGTPSTSSPTNNSTAQNWIWTAATDALSGIQNYLYRITGTTTVALTSTGSNVASFITSLGEGIYNFFVTAQDNAGNTSSESPGGSLTVDTTAPNTTIDSGPTGYVSNTSATFVFSANETSTFQCQIDNGGFSSCSSPKTYNGLSEGSHTFDVKATDTAGNPDLTPASNTWTVDTLAPTDPLDVYSTSHSTLPTSDKTINMAWSLAESPNGATDGGSGVDGYSYSFSQGAIETPDSIKDLEENTIGVTSLDLTDGDWYFNLRTIDNAGNITSTVNVGPLVIDTTPPDAPSITSSSHTLSTWNSDRTINTSWSASDPSGIAGYSYLWDLNLITNPDTISEGTNTSTTSTNRPTSQSVYFHIRTLDGAGNWSDSTHYGPFWIDAANPTNSWVNPLDGAILSGVVNLQVNVNDVGSGLKFVRFRYQPLGGTFVTIIEDTSSSYSTDWDTTGLANGSYILRARAEDNSGRINTKDITVTVDNTAPTVSISSTATSPTNISPIPMTAIFSENVTDFVVEDIAVGNGSADNFSGSGDTYNFDVTPLSDGGVTVDIAALVAQDSAGNGNEEASQFEISFDSQAPVSTFSSPENSSFWNSSINIEGSSTDSSLDTVSYVRFYYRESVTEGEENPWVEIPDSQLDNDDEDELFEWSFNWTPPDERVYDIKAEATDTAGNTENSPVVSDVTYDVTNPTTPGTPATTTPTNDNTPTWNWTAATDTYLDHYIFFWDTILGEEANSSGVLGAGTTNFTIPGLTPLFPDGTWYGKVRAFDTAGNSSTSGNGSALIDTTPPTVQSAETQDLNGDGKIDAMKLTFNESINDSQLNEGADGWDVADPAGSESIGTGDTPNDNILLLSFGQGPTPDSGNTPTVTYFATGGEVSTHDTAGNELASLSTVTSDGALPVILSAETQDVNGNGKIDAIKLTFSEDIKDISLSKGNADGWDVVDYGGEAIDTGSVDDDDILLLSITEGLSYDVNTTPTIRYLNSNDLNSTHDMADNELATIEKIATDKAAPTVPSANPAGGDYNSDQTVSLTAETLSQIRYTIDETTPSGTVGTVYSASILIGSNTVLKAVVTDVAGNTSDVMTETYGIAPVISSETSTFVGTTSTTITWTTDDLSTSRVVYDTVSHSVLGAAPNYDYANSTIEDSTKVTSHAVGITGLTSGTTYYYRTISHGSPETISVENSFKTDTPSSGGGGGTVAGATAPVCNDTKPGNAPTLLSAVAGVNSVTLTWSKASDPISYYLMTFGTSSGAQTYGNPNVGGSATTSYTVDGLSGGTTYYFKVRAGNGCAPGDFSNELSASPAGGFIEGVPAGFEAGVLGAATESAKLAEEEPTPTATVINAGLVKGIQTISKNKSLKYLFIILIFALIVFIIYKKRKSA